MIRLVEAVVSGGFREAMRVPPLLGDGWQKSKFRFNDGQGGFSRSRGRVSRSRALEMTGGKLNVTLEWKPFGPYATQPPRQRTAEDGLRPIVGSCYTIQMTIATRTEPATKRRVDILAGFRGGAGRRGDGPSQGVGSIAASQKLVAMSRRSWEAHNATSQSKVLSAVPLDPRPTNCIATLVFTASSISTSRLRRR